MINKIDNVVILGGGTSAWMCAAYLSANTENINITLVDKEIGNPVGVGEATLLNFGPFLRSCGFDESQWFNELDATYKAGILFPGWGSKDNLVWHPFYLNVNFKDAEDNVASLYDCWSHHQLTYSLTKISPLFEVSVHNKIDPYQSNHYAYHVDCGKLVLWLQDQLKDKIKIIKSEMVKVNRDQNKQVKSIILKNGVKIEGDLFVDCTGFKSLLADDPKRVNLEGRLYCNTAVAGHVAYQDIEEERVPYVISEAVEDGWIWRIPVQSRIGSGMVFNRNITDPEQAKINFCRYWENRITPDSLKVIDWTPYYRENPWEHNTVAIGLAGGFIEPLESTGIAIIQTGITNLCNLIKSAYWTEADRNVFNAYAVSEYNDCVDFINMHYSKSDIDSTFWNWVRKNYHSSELLNFYLEKLSSKDPFINHGKGIIFSGANWNCWLTQMKYRTGKKNNVTEDKAEQLLKDWYNHIKQPRIDTSINHTDFLNQ